MCVICSTIPMTLAIGTYTKAKWAEKQEQAIQRGENPAELTSPEIIGRMSLAVTGGLILGAVAYHTVVAPTTSI